MRLLNQLLLTFGVLAAFSTSVCLARSVRQAASTQLQARTAPAAISAGSQSRSRAAAEKQLALAFALRKKMTRRDLHTAIRLFTSGVRLLQASGASQQAASAELEAGDTYLMMSGYRQALAAYRRSLALAGDRLEPRCLALSHMARTYATIGRVHDALRYSGRAVALCQATPDKKTLGDALEAEGEARFWSANMGEAASCFTRARQLFSEANDSDGEALANMMLAQTINAGDREQSRQLVNAALTLWETNGNQYGAARAHLTSAFFDSVAGNFDLAQCHCGKALPVFQRVADKDNEAVALNILGMVARQSGDMETSLSDYRRARSDFAAVQDELGEAESIIGIGTVLRIKGNYTQLLPLYNRKLDLAERSHNRALVASALLDFATVYQVQRRYGKAYAKFQQALENYRAAGNRYGEGTTLMRLAGLLAERGKDEDALKLLEQALELKEKNGEVEDVARIEYVRARIYLQLNRLENARTEIEKTVAIIEAQRLRISKFDSRAQYFASVHEYYSLYIQTLMMLDRLHPDRGYMQLAFEAAEGSKVRALLDLLANTRETASCDELLARDSDPQLATKFDSEKPERPDGAPARSLTLPEVQAEIGDGNTVLLEYALGAEKSYAWVLDGKKISAHELPSAAVIHRSARAFREALIRPAAREGETVSEYLQRQRSAERVELVRARELGRILLAGLDLPPHKRVLVVPDGPLQYVPFAALSVTAEGAKPMRFIAQHDLTMLPSASVLAALRKAAAGRAAPTDQIAIFGDPVFQTNESGASAHTGVRLRSHLQRALQDTRGSPYIANLPGSRIEALAIQHIVGPEHTRLALGFNASRESVINGSLAHYRVIHFATHGIVDTRHPEMSGLILSLFNARGERQDGYLRLSDIYNLKLSADLVVLSSCDSALGKDMESEGIIGLPRGFLYAGARSVIATLWKVDDNATAALMKGLYSRMRRGKSPQTALREAQMDLARDAAYHQPYYWAGFVLEGDYRNQN